MRTCPRCGAEHERKQSYCKACASAHERERQRRLGRLTTRFERLTKVDAPRVPAPPPGFDLRDLTRGKPIA